MSLYPLVIGLFAVALLVGSVLWYARRAHDHLVDARENCETAWSNVEVLLQRRHDEVGNLVELAGEYMSMEQEILAGVIEAREQAIEANTPKEAAIAEAEVRDSIQDFHSLAEEFPLLRTDEKFDDITDSLQEVEQRLENRREYYNDAVRRYNVLLEKVPERYVADRRGYEPREPFEATEAAREEFSVRDRLHDE